MVRSSASDWAKQPGTAAPAAGGEHRLFDMLVHRGRTTSGLCTRSAKLCIFYAQVKSSLILRMFSVPHQDLIRRHRAFWSPCFNWQQVQDDPLKLGTVAKVQMPHLKLVYQKSARKHSIFWLSAFTFKREHASPFLLHLLINKKNLYWQLQPSPLCLQRHIAFTKRKKHVTTSCNYSLQFMGRRFHGLVITKYHVITVR